MDARLALLSAWPSRMEFVAREQGQHACGGSSRARCRCACPARGARVRVVREAMAHARMAKESCGVMPEAPYRMPRFHSATPLATPYAGRTAQDSAAPQRRWRRAGARVRRRAARGDDDEGSDVDLLFVLARPPERDRARRLADEVVRTRRGARLPDPRELASPHMCEAMRSPRRRPIFEAPGSRSRCSKGAASRAVCAEYSAVSRINVGQSNSHRSLIDSCTRFRCADLRASNLSPEIME